MHPILIAGVALAGLPVVLHLLLKQEPKRLLFPAIRFLKLKQKTTQRRLRLRHFILLALRVFVIALLCAALYQPTVPAFDAGGGFALDDGRPVAAVLVIDTSPSMGYLVEKRTRLEDAVRRAGELLDRLPAASRVAVVTTADPAGQWELTPADARRKLDTLQRPDGGGQPLSSLLRGVYPLFASVDTDSGSVGGGEPLPRLVAVFTDRAASSWANDQAADLKASADALSGGPPTHLFFDVGVDKPADVAVLAAEVRPAVVPAGTPVTVNATVQAVGPDIPGAFVRCRLSDGSTPQRQEVPISAGGPVPVAFTYPGLKAGVYQAEVSLETPDNLGPAGAPGFDNVRYVTFRVGAERKLLTICDDAADARLWQLAHQFKGDYGCDVATPAELPDLGGYDFVCLMNVRDPRPLWDKLKAYVDRGGRLLIAPGGTDIVLDGYDPAAALGLMPAKLVRVTDLGTSPAPAAGQPDLRFGAPLLLSTDALKHPLLTPLHAEVLRDTTDFLVDPRRAVRFWQVEAPSEAVAVRYADPDKSPAILEKLLPPNGKVVLLTTRLDSRIDRAEPWNDYWELNTSWPTYFPNLLARYLAGDGADATFQFTTGLRVALPLPKTGVAGKLVLEGPGVSGDDANPAPGAGVFELPPARTLAAGNYLVRTEDRSWQEGFSLNPPADEANLSKVPAEALEAVGGPESVVAAGKAFDLATLLKGRSGDVSLFPWLMVLLLLAFAAEGVMANRFYRTRAGPR